MSIEVMGRRRPAYTDQYSFVSGEYAIGEEKIPYFSISMTIKEADQFLRLARELAFSDDEPVNLEELFQRAVDEDRATGPIATYLLQPGSLNTPAVVRDLAGGGPVRRRVRPPLIIGV